MATWLNRLFVLGVVLVLARNLDARQFGVLGVATLASNVALQLNDGGMEDALIWWPGRVREAAETTLFSCIVVGATLGGLLALLAPAIATLFGAPDATPLLRVYGIAILFDAVGSAYLGMLTRELDFRRRFFPDVIPSVGGSVLTVVLALYWRRHLVPGHRRRGAERAQGDHLLRRRGTDDGAALAP